MTSKEKEDLLNAWLLTTAIIRNDRIVKGLPYNEAHVLRICALHYPNFVPVKKILSSTKVMKSQMNRTIEALLEKNYLEKQVVEADKRSLEIKITKEGLEKNKEVHEETLLSVEKVVNALGEKQSQAFLKILNTIVEKQSELKF